MNQPLSARCFVLALAGAIGALPMILPGRAVAAPAPPVQIAQVKEQAVDLQQLRQAIQQNPQLQEQAVQLLQQNPELVMQMMQTLIANNPDLIEQLQQNPAFVQQVAQQNPLLMQLLQQNPELVEQMRQLLE